MIVDWYIHNILEEHVALYADFIEYNYFEHDNARAHAARTVVEYIDGVGIEPLV